MKGDITQDAEMFCKHCKTFVVPSPPYEFKCPERDWWHRNNTVEVRPMECILDKIRFGWK